MAIFEPITCVDLEKSVIEDSFVIKSEYRRGQIFYDFESIVIDEERTKSRLAFAMNETSRTLFVMSETLKTELKKRGIKGYRCINTKDFDGVAF